MTAIRWILTRIVALGKWVLEWLGKLVGIVINVLSWWVAWVVTTIGYLIYRLFGWVGDLLQGVMSNSLSFSADLPVNHLANWIAHDVVALDVAWTAFAVYFSLWVACRVARGGWAGVRCILDLL